MSGQPMFKERLAHIKKLTDDFSTYMNANGFSEPTFESTTPLVYPHDPNFNVMRLKLAGALEDLATLVKGPQYSFNVDPILWKGKLAYFDVLNQFAVWTAIPQNGTASYDEIAVKTGVPRKVLSRLMKHALANHMFEETKPGSEIIKHNSFSSYGCKNYEELRPWVDHVVHHSMSSVSKLPEVIRKFSFGKDDFPDHPGQSSYALASWNSTADPSKFEVSLFDWLESEESKADGQDQTADFGKAMKWISRESIGYQIELLSKALDWEKMGQVKLIDVGGSTGHISAALVRRFPNIHAVIEDLPQLQPSFESMLDPKLASRMSFLPHNFFSTQTEQADVFLLKWILHDWSDEYAKRIIRNLIPVLKPGNKILLGEVIVHEYDPKIPIVQVPFHVEGIKAPAPEADPKDQLTVTPLRQEVTGFDLLMLSMLNSKERTPTMWTQLFAEVDPRFKIERILMIPALPQGVVVVSFNG